MPGGAGACAPAGPADPAAGGPGPGCSGLRGPGGAAAPQRIGRAAGSRDLPVSGLPDALCPAEKPPADGPGAPEHRRPGPADFRGAGAPGGSAGGVRPASADGGADPGPEPGVCLWPVLPPGGGGLGLCPAADPAPGLRGGGRGKGRPGRGYAAAPGAQPQRGHRHQAAPGLPARRGGGGIRRPHPAAGGPDGAVSRQSGAESQRRGHLSPAPAAHHRPQRRSGGAAGSPAAGAGHLRALWQDPPGRDGAQHRHQDPAHRQGV